MNVFLCLLITIFASVACLSDPRGYGQVRGGDGGAGGVYSSSDGEPGESVTQYVSSGQTVITRGRDGRPGGVYSYSSGKPGQSVYQYAGPGQSVVYESGTKPHQKHKRRHRDKQNKHGRHFDFDNDDDNE